LERELEVQDEPDLGRFQSDGWLQSYWLRVMSAEDRRQYAAIVDDDGRVIVHSDPDRAGGTLDRDWYDRRATEVGESVVETRSDALTAGEQALNVRIPIVLGDCEVGEYHAGFDLPSFNQWSAARESDFLRQRTLLVGVVLLIVLLAAASLYYIATHSVFLRRAVSTAHLEHHAEVSQLAAGLAHEIRNPLHAIRLNLHTFQRAQTQGSILDADELATMLDQSSREIDRIDRLMQELVGFATPEGRRDEVTDVKVELQGVIDFIDQEMVRSDIEVSTEFPRCAALVQFDPSRLRQIMLNLLHNAAAAVESNGRITVAVVLRSGCVEVTVADNGPGISDTDKERVFEPFFTTKSDGTGLGLALAKRLVEEAQGEIYCEDNPSGGTIFRMRLPEQSKPQRKAGR